jgi:endonuclease/exonuclease/phosphatase family metal-dependent hydrolase
MKSLRIVNWNAQADQQTAANGRSTLIKTTLETFYADVICLTEAYPTNFPPEGYLIQSERSGWGWPEAKGARKVNLWSKTPWEQVDTLGSVDLPEGRYLSAETQGLRLIGVGIPYHAYRTAPKWDTGRKTVWQGAWEYLVVFERDILKTVSAHQHTVILGDYNLQIPARGYPGKNSEVNRLRESAFEGWNIPTSGQIDDPAITKPFIDHIALTPDITVISIQYFSRFTENGKVMSDHNGVCIDIQY